VKIRLAVIVLLLAVLSPLVLSASPASADCCGDPTITTVDVTPSVVTQPGVATFHAIVSGPYFPAPSAAVTVDLGEVTFYAGNTVICIASLSEVNPGTVDDSASGSCSATTAILPTGTLTIGASYSGGGASDGALSESSSFLASSGTGTVTITVPNPTTPSIAVAISPAEPVVGGPAVFTLTVSPPISGTFQIQAGSIPLCLDAPVTNGVGTCTGTPQYIYGPGTSLLQAGFSPNNTADYLPVGVNFDMTVISAPAPTPTPTPTPTPAPTPTPTPTPTPPPVVTSPSSTVSHGYWLVGSDGGIFTFGNAQFYGSTGSLHLQRPVVSITPTSNDGGYWLVASDGGIFSFGDAGFYGSIPGLSLAPAGSGLPHSLNAPIVGMVPSADGGGYFMVGADGGVFTFGDAKYEGSCPGIGGCAGGAAVAVMPDASGNGYWVVTAGGYVTPFGDANSSGEPGPLSEPVVSAVL
jgi:hypothetical protein